VSGRGGEGGGRGGGGESDPALVVEAPRGHAVVEGGLACPIRSAMYLTPATTAPASTSGLLAVKRLFRILAKNARV